jgi:hypothetical protein
MLRLQEEGIITMRKLQVLFAVALVAMVGSMAQAAIPGGGVVGDDIISLVYDPSNGNLSVDAAGKQWSTLEILSPSGMFTGTATPGLVLPPFDVFSPTKYFLLKTTGLGDTDLGNVLAPGLSADQLAAELTVNGSVLPSGGLGNVDLSVVPEPSSFIMIGLGLLGLLGLRRK